MDSQKFRNFVFDVPFEEYKQFGSYIKRDLKMPEMASCDDNRSEYEILILLQPRSEQVLQPPSTSPYIKAHPWVPDSFRYESRHQVTGKCNN